MTDVLICDSAGLLRFNPSIGKFEGCDGTEWVVLSGGESPSGTVQVRRAEMVGHQVVFTNQMFFDNTIPQISEGTEVLSVGIEPTDASSQLLVEVVAHVSEPSNIYDAIIGAVFRDGQVDAVSASWANVYNFAGGQPEFMKPLTLSFTVPANSTSLTTFSLRVGGDFSSNPVVFNGPNNLRNLGNIVVSSLTVSEIKS